MRSRRSAAAVMVACARSFVCAAPRFSVRVLCDSAAISPLPTSSAKLGVYD